MAVLMSLAVLGTVAIIAYVLASQGFFSSLLHLACVITAGAMAFALWEPCVYLIAPRINSPALIDLLWGTILIVLFAIFLALLRTATDKLCFANTDLSHTQNLVGGGIAGILSGVLTAGVLLIGLQFIQGPAKIIGYSGWVVDQGGVINKAGGAEGQLWAPVDEWTSWYYSNASLGSMAVYEPLANWYPDLAQQASMYRASYENGASRMGMRPSALKVNDIIRFVPTDMQQFLSSLTGIDRDRQLASNGTGEVYSISISVEQGAWDGGSKLRLTKAQSRLVVEMPGGRMVPIHPHAFVQRYESNTTNQGRWPYDAGDICAISIGSAATQGIWLEFLVPAGATLHHLIVRNARVELNNFQVQTMTSEAAALAAIGNLVDVGADPAPNPGSIDKPPHWKGIVVMFLLYAVTMLISLRPAKRSHQD
ncbi:MAG: CvpA family protein [Planctomycetes bacterium]|nr:CvpA family protein [Planctomycetota bacterium]NOG54318.1 CvpA family protein [Planctomycetota bacterium]